MIGALVGDISGSCYVWDENRGDDFHIFNPGSRLTGISIMTLATARALESCGDDRENIRHETARWMHAFGQSYPDAGYSVPLAEWLKDCDAAPYITHEADAASRIAPCAWKAKNVDDAIRTARASCAASQTSMKGAESVAVAVYTAKETRDKNAILKIIEDNYYEIPKLDKVIGSKEFHEEEDDVVPKGICAALESEDFYSAILNAVKIGGNVSTIAAISGAVADGLYGVSDEYIRTVLQKLDSREYEVVAKFFAEK